MQGPWYVCGWPRSTQHVSIKVLSPLLFVPAAAALIEELARREEAEGIKPDPVIGAYMKAMSDEVSFCAIL